MDTGARGFAVMATTTIPSRPGRRAVAVIAIAAVIVHMSGAAFVRAQEPAAATEEVAARIPPEELDSLVAPIALYPDPLLAQVLVASTYPLEIIQLQQWLGKNPGLEGDALAEAVAKQPWDPSIQSMAAVPDAATRLADDIQWTTDLGNAFLAQQDDVMDAVQRMRKKAQDNGALESNEQQVVETKVVEQKTVIIVESAHPEVIYVPSYSPTVVYGPPPVYYPYPPIYYPPYPAGGAFVSFSVGVTWGAAIWGGSCCGCGWGQQRHQHQRQQQLQPEHQHQRRRWRQLAAQRRPPRRDAVRRQGDGEQVRRIGARRLDEQPAGERPPAGREPAAGPGAPAPDRRAGRPAPAPPTGRGAPGRAPAPRIGAERGHRQRAEHRADRPAADRRRDGQPRRQRPYRQPQHSVEQRTKRQRLRRQLERLQRRECPVGELAGRFQHGVDGVSVAAADVGGKAMILTHREQNLLRYRERVAGLRFGSLGHGHDPGAGRGVRRPVPARRLPRARRHSTPPKRRPKRSSPPRRPSTSRR